MLSLVRVARRTPILIYQDKEENYQGKEVEEEGKVCCEKV